MQPLTQTDQMDKLQGMRELTVEKMYCTFTNTSIIDLA